MDNSGLLDIQFLLALKFGHGFLHVGDIDWKGIRGQTVLLTPQFLETVAKSLAVLPAQTLQQLAETRGHKCPAHFGHVQGELVILGTVLHQQHELVEHRLPVFLLLVVVEQSQADLNSFIESVFIFETVILVEVKTLLKILNTKIDVSNSVIQNADHLQDLRLPES